MLVAIRALTPMHTEFYAVAIGYSKEFILSDVMVAFRR